MTNILIVGGDMRNVYIARELKKRGKNPLVYGIDEDKSGISQYGLPPFEQALVTSGLIILPLPVSGDGVRIHTPLYTGELFLADVIKYAPKDALICGGRVMTELFLENALEVFDYAKSEDFTSLNAVPTSEGAIEAVMKVIPTTIFSSKVIVTGFGKCAKVLSLTLKAMGAQVTVCARSKKDIFLAKALGLDGVSLDKMHLYLSCADIIFNTVPHRIFFARELDAIKEHTPFADIASSPGGADEKEARSRGINYMFLPSLPGRYSPKTASEIILDTIENYILESGKDFEL